MRLDIVIPAHDEEARIDRTLRAYRRGCDGLDVRLLVALDHCSDGTAAIVRRHAADDPRVVLLEYPKLGKGGVIMEAFRHCTADLVGFVDADCATPPAELVRLAEAARHADGAIASRRHPTAVLPARRPLNRRLASFAFATFVRLLFRLPYADTQCGAKVFRREAVERMLPYLSSRDLLFDVDLLLVAREVGCRVVEVPTVWIDRDGSRIRAATDTARMVTSSLRLWLHHRVLPVDRPPVVERPAPVVRHLPRQATPDVAIVSLYPRQGRRHDGRSGVASYTANLAHSLAEAGARVTVVAPRQEGEPAVFDDGGVRVERRFARSPAGLIRAAGAAIDTGARVVHLQHEMFLFGGPSSAAALGPALARLRRAGRGPVVTMHHVVDRRDIDDGFASLHAIDVPPAAARTAIGTMHSLVRSLAAEVIVHEPSFAQAIPGAIVVPHGIEQNARPGRREALLQWGGEDKPTVLCFGFLAPYKGLESALEASALAGSAIRLVVAGGPHPRMRRYAADLMSRWSDAAHFTGYVAEPDIPGLFAAADVALFAYPRPFSSSGAFALAVGYETPCLVSPALARCYGLPDEMVAPDDPMGLAKRFVSLAAEPWTLEAAAQATRELARQRSWPAVAARHLEIYAEVGHEPSTAGRRLRAG